MLTQYEREKQLRREAEEKFLEAEDSSDGEKVKLQGKMESMESLIRMLELKNKNFTEQVSRMEEKDSDVQKEFKKLHDRYTVCGPSVLVFQFSDMCVVHYRVLLKPF